MLPSIEGQNGTINNNEVTRKCNIIYNSNDSLPISKEKCESAD